MSQNCTVKQKFSLKSNFNNPNERHEDRGTGAQENRGRGRKGWEARDPLSPPQRTLTKISLSCPDITMHIFHVHEHNHT